MTVRCRVPAKLNLTFEVLGRRGDGYHEVRSLMQAVGIIDEIEVDVAAGGVQVAVDGAEVTEPNLAAQAANALLAGTAGRFGVDITIRKVIPVAAGLGGGSANAMATLVALNRLLGLDRPPGELLRLAAGLGSDVAFFLRGGTAVASGRGERCEAATPASGWAVILPATPQGGAKTRRAYETLSQATWTDGERTRRAAAGDRAAWGFNAFDAVAASLYPTTSALMEALRRAGLRPFLAGAGPSVALVAPDEASARTIGARVAELAGRPPLVAPFVDHGVQCLEGETWRALS